MWTDFRFPHGLSLLGVLMLIALALTACLMNLQQKHPVPSTVSSPTILTGISATHPTAATDTPVGTPTLLPATSTFTTATITPAPPDLEVLPIETDLSRCVEWAFWSDDESLVYYAFSQMCGDKPLRWATYDILNHSTTIISSPLKYDPGIWQRLGVSEPLKDVGLYPELSGYVSPSGKHAIYTVVHGSPGPGGPYDPSARTEIWIADSNGRNKAKLFSTSVGIIHQAVWIKDETEVIFDFGYEGGVSLYIADVRTGKLIPWRDTSEFRGGTEQKWAASPDGTTLAIVSFDYTLWLVSLTDGKARAIEKSAGFPYWTKDGNLLCYWWGPSYRDAGTLRAYNTISRNVSTLVPQSSFERVFKASTIVGDFSVSSSGDKLLLWGGDLWLVELHK